MIPSGIIWSRFDLVCCCRLVAGGRVAGVWGMSGGIVCVCVRARVRVPVGAVLPRTQESDTEGRRHRGVVNKKNNKKNNLVINGLTAVSRFSWIYLCFGGGVVVVVFWFVCVCVCVCVARVLVWAFLRVRTQTCPNGGSTNHPPTDTLHAHTTSTALCC
jgi:hypothetical protein